MKVLEILFLQITGARRILTTRRPKSLQGSSKAPILLARKSEQNPLFPERGITGISINKIESIVRIRLEKHHNLVHSLMSQSNSNLPILYSLQHCPYAMRARLGILLAQQSVLIRAMVTKNKPAEMLAVSPKGTVPVLVIDHVEYAENPHCKATIIEESIEIMLWALKLNDPEDLLQAKDSSKLGAMLELIRRNDKEFKPNLEIYKLAKRFHKESEVTDRQSCEGFVAELEKRLETGHYLMGDQASLADYALLPFVRQFARVDRKWYLQSPYPRLRDWLNRHLQMPLFTKAMAKYPLWLDSHEAFLLGKN